jgi:NADH-quinone oxidoreductase subunit C
MAKGLIELITRRFSDRILAAHSNFGDETIVVLSSSWYEIHAWLRDDPEADMQMLVDLTAVDNAARTPRFEVVTHLLSLRLGHRIRVKAQIGDTPGEAAHIATLTPLWASANWAERECFDLMGLLFTGHPDLRRLMLYPEFIGHPLRKDYPAAFSQPLVPYREGASSDKVSPFGSEEGMPLDRNQRPLRTGEALNELQGRE